VGTSGLVAEAVGALGDLDQDPVGGGEVVWVQVGVEALGQGGDGVGQSGVEGGTFGGELGGPGAVGGAAGDEVLGFKAAEEFGDLGAVEADLWLAGEVVVEGGG
jgi:hypothetical protein